MSNTNFIGFTGKYSLSKTLRFELRPQGKTKDLIKEFKEGKIENTLKIDELRAKEYSKMKIILDDYYREFIEKNTIGRALEKGQTL